MATKAITKTEKQQLSDAKVKMKDRIKAAKEKYRQERESIKAAKRIGYSSGSFDYAKIAPISKAKTAAKKSYGQALDDGDKIHKLQNKFYQGRMNENAGKKTK